MTIVRDYDTRFFIMLAVNLGLYFVMLLLNDAFAGFSVYLFMPALLLVAPSLFLGRWESVLMGVIIGFLFEANAPIEIIGINAFVFGLFCYIINSVRDKFRSLDAFAIMWLTWAINILLFVVCVLFIYPRGIEFWNAYLIRLTVDIVVSSMVVILFSSYVINLQKSVCYVLGKSLSIEQKDSE